MTGRRDHLCVITGVLARQLGLGVALAAGLLATGYLTARWSGKACMIEEVRWGQCRGTTSGWQWIDGLFAKRNFVVVDHEEPETGRAQVQCMAGRDGAPTWTILDARCEHAGDAGR